MSTFPNNFITAGLVVAIGAGIYEACQVSALRDQVQTLQEQALLAAQNPKLLAERDATLRQLADLRHENERHKRDSGELLKLRGEVALLRDNANALTQAQAALTERPADGAQAMANVWALQIRDLKDVLAKAPYLNIPEIAVLEDSDWMESRADGNPDDLDDEGSVARRSAICGEEPRKNFANYLVTALWKYAQANSGLVPSIVSSLKPYFPKLHAIPFVDDAMLQRYAIVQGGTLSNAPGRELIVENSPPVDPSNDFLFKFGPKGFRYQGVGANKDLRGVGDYSPRSDNGE